MSVPDYTCRDVNETAVDIFFIILRDSDRELKTDWYWCTRLQQCRTVGAVKLCSIPDSQQKLF